MVMFDLTLQGRSHIRDNIPCQDKAAILEHAGARCIALADGAGSAKLAHYGAQSAVTTVAKLLCSRFEEFYVLTAQEVSKIIISEILAELAIVAKKHACSLQDLASTLLFATVKDGKYIIGNLGDGVIAFCMADGLQVASRPERGEFANQTWFTTISNPEDHLRLKKGVTSGVTGIFLMTDGAADSLYQKATGKLAPFIKRVVFELYYKDRDYFEHKITTFFKNHILTRTSDDCGIAVISLLNNYTEFFKFLNKDEIRSLFYGKKRLKKEYTNDYVVILENVHKTNCIETLSGLTQLPRKTLKLRIGRLRKLAFAAVQDPNKFK